MLSSALEALGLAVITAGTTVGVWVLAGYGWGILAAGLTGGASLLFVGVALSAPSPAGPSEPASLAAVRRRVPVDRVEAR